MNHVLLIEPRPHEALKLVEHMEANGRYRVYRAHSLREACNIVIRHKPDLALLPVLKESSLIYSLRLLQPTLPIFLLVNHGGQAAPAEQADVAHGVLSRAMILNALHELERFTLPPQPMEADAHGRSADMMYDTDRVIHTTLTLLAQHLFVHPPIMFMMVLQKDEMIGYHRRHDDAQLEQAAQVVRAHWDQRPRTAQIEFLPHGRRTVLMLTRPTHTGLLTLGAHPDTPLSKLHGWMNDALEKLHRINL